MAKNNRDKNNSGKNQQGDQSNMSPNDRNESREGHDQDPHEEFGARERESKRGQGGGSGRSGTQEHGERTPGA